MWKPNVDLVSAGIGKILLSFDHRDTKPVDRMKGFSSLVLWANSLQIGNILPKMGKLPLLFFY